MNERCKGENLDVICQGTVGPLLIWWIFLKVCSSKVSFCLILILFLEFVVCFLSKKAIWGSNFGLIVKRLRGIWSSIGK